MWWSLSTIESIRCLVTYTLSNPSVIKKKKPMTLLVHNIQNSNGIYIYTHKWWCFWKRRFFMILVTSWLLSTQFGSLDWRPRQSLYFCWLESKSEKSLFTNYCSLFTVHWYCSLHFFYLFLWYQSHSFLAGDSVVVFSVDGLCLPKILILLCCVPFLPSLAPP